MTLGKIYPLSHPNRILVSVVSRISFIKKTATLWTLFQWVLSLALTSGIALYTALVVGAGRPVEAGFLLVMILVLWILAFSVGWSEGELSTMNAIVEKATQKEPIEPKPQKQG
jgi:hypothetical protein